MSNKTITQNNTEDTHNSLRRAVKNALERKRKLGHYNVQWRANKIVIDGLDAPTVAEPATINGST